MRQEKRKNQVAAIKANIEKALLKGAEVNFKNVVLAMMSGLNISRRTAQEYVEVAFFDLEIDKDGKSRTIENTSNAQVNTE